MDWNCMWIAKKGQVYTKGNEEVMIMSNLWRLLPSDLELLEFSLFTIVVIPFASIDNCHHFIMSHNQCDICDQQLCNSFNLN
jgi:hypothetical protein